VESGIRDGFEMKKGDFIKIDYVARTNGTNELFDLTRQDVAENEKLDTKGQALKPVTIILGAGHVIRGLEAELEKMSVGEEKKLIIPAKDGFGARRFDMIRTLPAGQVKGQLTPGAQVAVGRTIGRIQSASGGRIRVDLNHPLAGKDLLYEIKIIEKLEKPEEKIFALLERHTKSGRDYSVAISGQKAAIISKKGEPTDALKETLSKDILTYIHEIKEVIFPERSSGK